MARVELPASRLKARKRKHRTRLLLIVAAVVLIVCGLLVGASYIPALLIREIRVSGTETIASTTLRSKTLAHLEGSYLYLFPHRNIFLYPKQEIREALMRTYPSFASVDVHAVDFHTIAVNVVERHPRALWCAEGRCYFMDEGGVVYAESPVFSEPIYISYGGAASGTGLPKQYLTPTQFQSLSALVDAIAQRLTDEQVLRVEVDSAEDVRVFFASGFMLIFPLSDQGGDVFERFGLALKAEPLLTHTLAEFEYLDLRFGDKLYYKLKEKEPQERP